MIVGRLSDVLRSVAGEQLGFWCPGCDECHVIKYGAGGWTWNNDVNKPTFTPSVKVTGLHCLRDTQGKWTGEYVCDAAGKPLDFICHSFVTDGMIQYLSDCTHALVGQTVPLGTWPARYS